MEQDKFTAMMPFISADLVALISQKENIPETEAITKLYSSTLYSLLEQEDMKLWHYSTPMLYEMFRQGVETGKIDFPDV